MSIIIHLHIVQSQCGGCAVLKMSELIPLILI